MSIWGRRDGEPAAEEAHESQAGVHDAQAPATEHQAEEPTPAFWRTQGETPAPLERDPADAPPPAYEHVPDNPPPAGVPPTMGPTPAYGQQEPSEAPAPVTSEARGADAPLPGLTGVVIAGETAVKDPGLTETPGDQASTHDTGGGPAVTEIQEPTVAVAHEPVVSEDQGSAGADPLAATAITTQRWSEILVAFVDDPRGSVKMAADAVDEAIDEFVNSVRAHQRDLASTWQSHGADTEQLRSALREYRKLGQRVRQLDLGDMTGG